MKSLLTVILFISPVILFAQSIQKGFVVLTTGDTLRGFINYKPGQRNPKEIKFRKDSLNKNTITYTTSDINYAEITGYDAYVKAVADKSVPINMVLPLSNALGDTIIKQVVFLKLLLKGDKLSLYEREDEKVSYYVQEGAGDYQELLLKKTMVDGYERELPVYRNQLMGLAGKYGMIRELERKITNLGYDEDALKDIISHLNGNNSIVRYTSKRPKAKWSFLVNAGAALSTLKLSGDKSYVGNLEFDNYVSPYFSAGAELSNMIRKVSLRFEIGYYMAKYVGSGTAYTSSINKVNYEVEQRNIVPSLAVHYAFVEQKQWNMFFGLGAGFHISSYSKNIWSQSAPALTLNDYATLKKTWVAMNVKLGVRLWNKIEIGSAMRFLDDFIGESTMYSFDTRTYLFWVGYRF